MLLQTTLYFAYHCFFPLNLTRSKLQTHVINTFEKTSLLLINTMGARKIFRVKKKGKDERAWPTSIFAQWKTCLAGIWFCPRERSPRQTGRLIFRSARGAKDSRERITPLFKSGWKETVGRSGVQCPEQREVEERTSEEICRRREERSRRRRLSFFFLLSLSLFFFLFSQCNKHRGMGASTNFHCLFFDFFFPSPIFDSKRCRV